MKTDQTMERLRAARPTAVESRDHASLFAQIVAEPGDPRLGQATHKPSRLRALKRPRVLAGGSLGIAGIAAVATLAFSGGAAAPAFAVTRQADGGVLVTVSSAQGLPGADRQLIAMGINEEVNYSTAPGPATSSAPVACASVAGPGSGYHTPSGYESAKPSGAPVKLLLGTDNTQVIPSGQTGAGTVHLTTCVYYPAGPGTQLGNSGTKFLNANGGQ
jgi:hypothetical protein